MSHSSLQGRNWVFTLNNPLAERVGDDPADWDHSAFRYLVYQLELGESGTAHWQGYVSFAKNVRLGVLKELSPRANWDLRRGTHEQARAYCTKDEGRLDGPYEYGDPPVHQGERSDIATTWAMLKAKASDFEILEVNPGAMRYARGIAWARQAVPVVQRSWKTEVFVYWGTSGSGKSFRAFAEAGPNAYSKPPATKWFDGYTGQENVVFDEFLGNWFDVSTLLRLLDAYPMAVEPKGGTYIPFLARRLWITTNIEPLRWYPNINGLQLAALLRRLDHIENFTVPYVAPGVTLVPAQSSEADTGDTIA